jgi:hypothetical protein
MDFSDVRTGSVDEDRRPLTLFRRERFADANLNYRDEALAHIATAVLLARFEAR